MAIEKSLHFMRVPDTFIRAIMALYNNPKFTVGDSGNVSNELHKLEASDRVARFLPTFLVLFFLTSLRTWKKHTVSSSEKSSEWTSMGPRVRR